jgi:hypothetical protein
MDNQDQAMENQEHDEELMNLQRRKTVPKFVLEEFVKCEGEEDEASLSDEEELKQEEPTKI